MNFQIPLGAEAEGGREHDGPGHNRYQRVG